MKVISSEKLPIKMWLDEVEDSCMAQIKNLANLPFAFKHIAIMPDSHTGYGMPIGGVLATKGVVIPNAVGVDIGCGMIAVRTSLKEITTEQLKTILGKIRLRVPVGYKHHGKPQIGVMPKKTGQFDIVDQEFGSAMKQIGTLGGGNHFIEIQKEVGRTRCKQCGDSPSIYNLNGENECIVCRSKRFYQDGNIWIMIHSGSRNLGYKVAKYYNNIAYDLNKKWYSDTYLPKNKENSLAFFPMGTGEYNSYIKEMNYCLEFALANRKLMMERTKQIFCEESNCEFENAINIHHNYATMENHFGQNVMIHRKGATSARKGQLGIIPGSQGTKSYIVRGLGNPESFNSCSHGAGRKMGRNQARRELNLEEEQKKLEDKGILHSVRSIKQLDESSGAYKDIAVVMANQSDLVEIIVELTPLGVIKG